MQVQDSVLNGVGLSLQELLVIFLATQQLQDHQVQLQPKAFCSALADVPDLATVGHIMVASFTLQQHILCGARYLMLPSRQKV